MDSILNFFLCFTYSLATVPVFTALAVRFGIVDVPDERKVHKKIIPRLGGLSMVSAVFLYVVIFIPVTDKSYYYLLANGLIFAVGVYDDSKGASPKLKIISQVAAALVVIFLMDIRFQTLGSSIPLFDSFIVEAVLTIAWLIFVTNAVNLIDGVDGLAGGISFISFTTLALIFYQSDQFFFAVCISLMGSILGFLRYNLPKASVFMGDTGSLFLGFNIALMSLSASYKTATMLTVIIPVLFISLPVFDAIVAIFRRAKKGMNPLKPDREHIHHKLLDLEFTPNQILLVFYSLSIFLSIIALYSYRQKMVYGVLAACFMLYLFLLMIKTMKKINISRRLKIFNRWLRMKVYGEKVRHVFDTKLRLKSTKYLLYALASFMAAGIVFTGAYAAYPMEIISAFAVLAVFIWKYKENQGLVVSYRSMMFLILYAVLAVRVFQMHSLVIFLFAAVFLFFFIFSLSRIILITRVITPLELLAGYALAVFLFSAGYKFEQIIWLISFIYLGYIPHKIYYYYLVVCSGPDRIHFR